MALNTSTADQALMTGRQASFALRFLRSRRSEEVGLVVDSRCLRSCFAISPVTRHASDCMAGERSCLFKSESGSCPVCCCSLLCAGMVTEPRAQGNHEGSCKGCLRDGVFPYRETNTRALPPHHHQQATAEAFPRPLRSTQGATTTPSSAYVG